MGKDIRDLIFDSLPPGPDQWLIVAWGKIVNQRTGSYKQEIVLKKYSDKDIPTSTWDLRDPSQLFFSELDIGKIKVLSPGTIVQNKKIKLFIEDYLKPIQITVDDPQSLHKKPLRVIYDPIFPDWERKIVSSSVDKVETRVFHHPDLGFVMIPSTSIADYFCYGTVYLTKAVLEGKIDHKFQNRNDAYNPNRIVKRVSPINKMAIVLIELGRKMDFKDRFKIARLAYDDFFRHKVLDIFTNISNGEIAESYIDMDLPVTGPTTLTVFGVPINGKGGRFFLVHSIAMCSTKAPFDLVLAGKDFRRKSSLFNGTNVIQGSDTEEEDRTNTTITLTNLSRPAKRTITHLKENGDKNIGDGKTHWDSLPEELEYRKNQADNFSEDNAINEADFADPEKQEKVIEIMRKFGISLGLSTSPDKTSSDYTMQLKIFADGFFKPKPPPPTTAFQIIEKLTDIFYVALTTRGFNVTSSIRCPIAEGNDKYSVFPVEEFRKEPNLSLRKRYVNYCYIDVRSKGQTHFRRVFICELIVKSFVFYFMDVEPKYKIEDKQNEFKKYMSSFGVIFFAGKNIINDVKLEKILRSIVVQNRTSSCRWDFLESEFGFLFQRIKHHSSEQSIKTVSRFVYQTINR